MTSSGTEEDNTHEQFAGKFKECLNDELSHLYNIELYYIDINSPEVFDYMNDMSNIMGNNLQLPYISINDKPVIWGSTDIEDILNKIEKKLAKASKN